ncbi:uncharacterized protein LOC112465014 [Temnothorax curvispinosus]|uniref:Uncharacterized protein LOC112465014 n=1 Tax=Temnothorax curvispinosus TaxID=300111 RepID=A0A6J1R0J3_9HYME|nr:uncharacterized protein LOC112465014 [Temnothorax curvispinosus]
MALHWILQLYLLRCTLFVVIARAEEVFNTTPPTVRTRFSCFNRPMGFYADVEANCKIYHTCDDHGNKFTYRCPEETAFRQDALTCDHAHLVDCQATVHPSTQFPNENVDEEIVRVAASTRSPVESINSLDDDRLSFSRSFQVIQRPDKSMPNKFQSGFVFRASLFLRNQDRNQARQITDTCTTCDTDSRNRISTARPPTKQIGAWNPHNEPKSTTQSLSLSLSETRDKNTVYFNRPYEPLSNSSPTTATTSEDNQRPPFPREKFPLSSYNSDFHPYSETLRSIQASAHTTYVKSTTEIPVHALTMSLKPLVPNELEYDPYYPKQATSTEAYYTPSNRNRVDTNVRFSSSSQAPLIVARPNLPFEIPSVLPDLNTLEDLVDRRKFFYIPRANVKSI